MSDEWMRRMTAHAALNSFVEFMVLKDDHEKCVAIKIKKTGQIIYDGDKRISEIIGPAFKTLQKACFYDFGKDMEGCTDK